MNEEFSRAITTGHDYFVCIWVAVTTSQILLVSIKQDLSHHASLLSRVSGIQNLLSLGCDAVHEAASYV